MSQLRSIAELNVVDVAAGLAPGLFVHLLRGLGGRVQRREREPDPFYERYPAYSQWHSGSERLQAAELESALSRADVCIVGGESHPDLPPGITAQWARSINERLVVVDFDSASTVPVTDLLAQARAGAVFDQQDDRASVSAFPAPSYGAALIGLGGMFVALVKRLRTGCGALVPASLSQGAALWCGSDLFDVENDVFGVSATVPKGVSPMLFRCSDGEYVQMVMGIPNAFGKVARVVGMEWDDDPLDIGVGRAERGSRNFYFPEHEELTARIAEIDHATLLEGLRSAGIACGLVQAPGVVWDSAQIQHNDLIATSSDGGRSVRSPIRIREVVRGDRGPIDARSAERPRVIDLAAFVAGPFASKLLADVGMDVVKVEPPRGDPNRASPNFFAASNRGKRSVAVDAKQPRGREIIRRLCATSVAAHQNFRPGVAARLGLDAESLREVAPSLVTLEAPGFGLTGPDARAAAFDPVIQALTGMSAIAGGAGNAPRPYRLPIVDFVGGAVGSVALMAGVYDSLRSGESVALSVNLIDVGVFMTTELVERPGGELVGLPELDASCGGTHPAEHVYRTSDGWLAVSAQNEASATSLADALGLAGRFGPRREWGSAETDQFAAVFAELTTAAATDLLEKAEVWVAPCATDGWAHLTDSVSDSAPGVVTYATPELGRVRYPAPAFPTSFGFGEPVPDVAGPRLGEHTREILEELGYSIDEIDSLVDDGVVVADPSTTPVASASGRVQS